MKKIVARETVIAAYAESACGPGWANQPIWLIVRGIDGTLRQECLQPTEQSAEMQYLYGVSQAAHLSMTAAVRRAHQVAGKP